MFQNFNSIFVYSNVKMLIRKMHIYNKHNVVYLPTFTLQKRERETYCRRCLNFVIHNK